MAVEGAGGTWIWPSEIWVTGRLPLEYSGETAVEDGGKITVVSIREDAEGETMTVTVADLFSVQPSEWEMAPEAVGSWTTEEMTDEGVSMMLPRPPLPVALAVEVALSVIAEVSAPPAVSPAPMTLMDLESPVLSVHWYSLPGELLITLTLSTVIVKGALV